LNSSPSAPDLCPLCCRAENYFFHQDNYRLYLRCKNCALCFVPSDYHLTDIEEREEYDKHQNSPLELGYRAFLSRLTIPLSELLPKGAEGLDFGCGPGPTLSVMMEEYGFKMELYDKFYAADVSVLSQMYDFVTATEVVEHLRTPAQTLAQVWQCVAPGGYLGLMTKMVIDREAFAKWHYKNDRTHVVFFSTETLSWLAAYWQAPLVFQSKDVFIFKKPKVNII